VDVVTLWDVLEHLTDPVAALAAVPRWLRPGGLLVVQTQNFGGVTAAWMGRRWEQFVEFHLYHFSSRTLRRALERAGFHAVRIEDVEAFADPGPPDPAPDGGRGLRGTLRRLRDGLFVLAGYDRFNVMIATARRPGR
jgi:SAM-dependent methyltransferase